MTNEYCTICGQELPDDNSRMLKSIFFKDLPRKINIDGNPYCEKCGKAIVEKRRKANLI